MPIKTPTIKKITDETEYKSVMTKIEKLMSKGRENTSKSELEEIRKLALEAQRYEQDEFTIAGLSGVVALPKESDHKKDYSDYLFDKYGPV